MGEFNYIVDPNVRGTGHIHNVARFTAMDGAACYVVLMGERWVTYRADELDFEIRYV